MVGLEVMLNYADIWTKAHTAILQFFFKVSYCEDQFTIYNPQFKNSSILKVTPLPIFLDISIRVEKAPLAPQLIHIFADVFMLLFRYMFVLDQRFIVFLKIIELSFVVRNFFFEALELSKNEDFLHL